MGKGLWVRLTLDVLTFMVPRTAWGRNGDGDRQDIWVRDLFFLPVVVDIE